LGNLHIEVWTHVKIESKSNEQMRPTKSDKAEGGYYGVCPEGHLSEGHIKGGEGKYEHEHDKMTFIIEADTLVYPCGG
jgi:hypothetical protein